MHYGSPSIRSSYANKPIPSKEIGKGDLGGARFILWSSKTKSYKPGTLTQLLARELFFDEALMARCTLSGTKDLPALPKQEMYELTNTVFDAFPKCTMEAFKSEYGEVNAGQLWSKLMAAFVVVQQNASTSQHTNELLTLCLVYTFID